MEKISRKKPLVFLDICIDGAPAERMVFELFTDVAPKTAENFRVLCTGEKGVSSETGKPLHYKGTFFHLIIKGHVAQAGDFLRQGGKFGESIYGGKFPGDSPKLKHDGPGLLTMAMGDRDERGSLFYVTFKADHHLDRKSVVFGRLVDGLEVLKKIETAGDEEGNPTVTVKIINSGELPEDKKKWARLKMGNDTIVGNYNADRRKGKHKKSSKKRKKRRKYYTSESDSTTDTDMESSESDSDSDSYDTSLSDTSSSSDDHRRKRKRSKRDKKKHGKRKDRRREKRRKRRDRKTKRKSKRNNSTDSENVSKSGSSSEDNAVVEALDGKRKSSRNQSPVQQREISTINHKKGDDAGGMSESEEGGVPKENGNHQGNDIGPETESDQSPDRHPDPVDNHPSKSRSRNLSPRRTLSKNMSLSPRKNAHRSPSVSGSPQQIFNKSKSNSPVRSESSRSPIRSPPRITKGINRSMSPPVRSPSRRSRSRSPMVSPPRRRVAQSPPRTSSRRSSHRSLSRSPKRPLHRSVSRSSGRAPPPRRSPSPSPVRAPNRITRRSYSRSPVSAGRRARSPVSDRGRSSSRSRSVDHGSPKRIRRGRGFSDRYSYVRRYRSRSPDRSPIRSYRYGGRGDRDRYSSYRRSPRRYRSPPRGRTPPRYRGRRSRTRSPSVSRSPIRTRKHRSSPSRSPVRSNSPVDRYKAPVRGERLKSKSPSRSRSRSKSRSSRDSRSPRHADKVNSRSSLEGSPQKAGLVSYEDGSPNSGRG